MLKIDYQDAFAVRGAAYHEAMRLYPTARALEFERLFDRFPVRPGECVLDVPAGGGYLRNHLPPGADLTSLELTSGFGPDMAVVDPAKDWPVGTFDHVVCLAALHHIDDQPGFIRKLATHTKPGGIVHIADVARATPQALLLDGFVGDHNGTGHRGRYLPHRPDPDVLGDAVPAFYAERACPWRFEDERQLVAFCMGLFGLDGATPEAVGTELRKTIGIESGARGGLELQWRLTYCDIRRPLA